MPRPVLDFWFDFASTYSYLAAMRIGPLAQKADVRVRFRPFLLGPSFKAQVVPTSPFDLYPAKGRHMWRDLERSCAELQLPFRRPDPFPQNSLLAARVALAGLDQRWGEEFCRALFRAEFADGRRIDDAAAVGDVLAGLEIDPRPRWRRPDRMRSKRGCGRKPRRRSGSASSARRASRPPTASCSGAMTGSSPRCVGRKPPLTAARAVSLWPDLVTLDVNRQQARFAPSPIGRGVG